jgi:peptidyl-prolyl cis-trans isomerase SurA
MTKNTWLFLLFLCVCCAFAVRGQAQNYVYNTGDKPAADKIIAIVGDKIILQSDLENMLVKQKQQYSSLPPNASCMILEQMLSQNALTLQAEKDSLPISDDEVEQNLEHRINYFISIYGSQQKMEQVLGMSIYQIKDKYRSDIKDIMLAQAEQKKIVDEVKITPTEVEAFFKKIPTDSLPFFKSEVEVGQIVINPKPSADVVAYIIGQHKGYPKEALSGCKTF